jgi:integrase
VDFRTVLCEKSPSAKMKGLYRRGNRWWLRFTPARGAAERRLSTGESDEAKAITFARQILAQPELVAATCLKHEIELYQRHLRQKERTERYIQEIGEILCHWAEAIGEVEIALLRPRHIEVWKNLLAERNIQASTVTHYLRYVSQFLNWALQERKIRDNPARGLVDYRIRSRPRANWLRPEQADRLIAAAADMELRYILLCGFDAGLRKDEVVMSRPEWFDLEGRMIYVVGSSQWSWRPNEQRTRWRPKDKEDRVIPLSKRFALFLAQYGWRYPYMLRPQNKANNRARYRYDFKKRFDNLMAREHVSATFHDLRRSFASKLVTNGYSIHKVAKWLGDDVAVAEKVYGHLAAEAGDINSLAPNVIQMPLSYL